MTQAVIATTVTGMQGRPIATTVPATNQAYTWSGTAWAPTGPFLALAGGILTGALRLQYTAPVAQIFNDTSTSITAGGLFREVLTGGQLLIQSNTATAGDFSTVATALTLGATGGVTVGNGLTVNGAINATGTASVGTVTTTSGGLSTFSGPVTTTGTLTSTANVRPAVDNGASCGFAGAAWAQVAAYAFPQQSDPRTKKDIAAAPADPLAQVLAIPIHTYRFLNDAETAPLHWGFLSTEVHQTMGDNFAGWMQGTDENQTESLNMMDMIAVLWAAVQELAQKANVT